MTHTALISGSHSGLTARASAAITLTLVSAACLANGTAGLPDLPTPITSFGAAALGGNVYVFGGHTGKTHAHSRDNVTGDFLSTPLAGGGEWTVLEGDTPMQGTTLVADASGLYRIGGLVPHNETAEETADLHSSDSVRRFDPATKSWSDYVKLPFGLSSHDAAVTEGRIYVFGGWTLSGDSHTGVWNDRALTLDPGAEKPEWKDLPAPPFRRRALAAVGVAGKLHVLGGMDESEAFSVRHDVFDPKTGKWSTAPELPEGGFGLAACNAEERLIVSMKSGDLLRLSTDGSKWENAGRLRFARFFHRVVPAGPGTLVALGGVANRKHTAATEIVKIEEAAAGEGLKVSEISIPGSAKNRQGIFIAGDEIILFGGNNSTEQHDFKVENFESEAWRVNLATGEVRPFPAYPFARQSMLTLQFGDGERTGIAFGGFGHDGRSARTRSELIECDLEKGEWKTLGTALPLPLTQFGLIRRGTEAWIFGGMDFDPGRGSRNQFQIQNDVYRWDRARGGEFETVETKLPNPRRAFGSVELDGKVYLVGGMKDNFEPVEPTDVYDLASGEWSAAPSPEHPVISPDLAALEGKIYMACGSTFTEADGFQSNTSVLAFDPAANRWSSAFDHVEAVPRHARMVAMADHLMIFATVPDGEGVALRVIRLRP